MKTIEKTIYELCEEVDYWKDKAEYYKVLFEEERDNYSTLLNNQLKSSREGIANALMLCMSIEDNKDGSLSISKENREFLKDNYIDHKN